MDDGTEHGFDLVVAADGYRSQIRRALFPGSDPSYWGYVCWRGVMDEREMNASELMDSTFARFGCHGMPGSFLYPVTGADGSVTRGERLINWGCYVQMPASELDDFFIDREGRRHDGTTPPGMLRPEHEARFKALARESLPPYYADIVSSSRDTFAQEVFSASVPDYHAGASASPATRARWRHRSPAAASSRQRATQSSWARNSPRTTTSMRPWPPGGAAEAATGAEIIELGRQYDRAFMDGRPDFGAMDGARASRWLADSIRDPEGFTFVASA